MTKHELIKNLAGLSGLKIKEAAFIVDNLLELIIKKTSCDEKVELRGFGTFYKSLKKERKIFSPIAGREVTVPAEAVLNFKQSKVSKRKFSKKGA